MILVIDACAFINLLQALEDEKYFEIIEAEFEELHIASDKVKNEIRANLYKNLLPNNSDKRQEIDSIAFPRIERYANTENTDSCQEFLQHATGYLKRNGEFYSVALALYLSRMGGNDICEQLLKVHLVSDDSGVTEDFEPFYRTNQIGQIISSSDLMTVLYIRERITRKDLENFFFSLQSIYSRKLSQIRDELSEIQKSEKDGKILSLLSELIELLYSVDLDRWKKLKGRLSRPQKARYKDLFDLVEIFFEEGSLEQINRIEAQRKQIEKVWIL